MFEISSNYLDIVLKASTISSCLSSERDIIKSLSYPNRNNSAPKGAQFSVHKNPNYLFIQFGAKSNKNLVHQKGQRITYILTRPCMIFSSFFSEVKQRFCRYMQGKESLLYWRFFQQNQEIYLWLNYEVK